MKNTKKIIIFLLYLFLTNYFVLVLNDNLFAIDYFNTIANNSSSLKSQFKKEGGSDKGVKIIEEEATSAKIKEKMLSFKNNRDSLKNEMNKILSANIFDYNKYKSTKDKINNIHLDMIKDYDSLIGNILAKLDLKDRLVISKLLKTNSQKKSSGVKK
jgi:hypothetical protein